MKKRMIMMLVALAVLFTIVFGFKIGKGILIAHYMERYKSPTMTVSAMKVGRSSWQHELRASASVRAVQGVNVTTQLGGMVKSIYFVPGAMTQKGDLLVQLDIAPDVAALQVLEANAQLAQINYTRDKAQYAIHAVSKAVLDTDSANLKSAVAQVAQQKAIIEQKTIRAPFSGRLGISKINLGQYLNPGDAVTMLQTLDPIYVDFYVPQQAVDQMRAGQRVQVSVEPFKNKTFIGKITTIDPGLDPNVRNVQVEATVPNADHFLAPGMFATVSVNTGDPKDYITLPQTAVSFNPYGEIVFVILSQDKTGETGKPVLKVRQRFIKTGDKRGDQVTVLSGLQVGEMVVTSGQLKLKNDTKVEINNMIQPLDDPSPNPADE